MTPADLARDELLALACGLARTLNPTARVACDMTQVGRWVAQASADGGPTPGRVIGVPSSVERARLVLIIRDDATSALADLVAELLGLARARAAGLAALVGADAHNLALRAMQRLDAALWAIRWPRWPNWLEPDDLNVSGADYARSIVRALDELSAYADECARVAAR